MFDPDFFPTPGHVISQMMAKVSKDARYFLEPQAGTGEIAQRIAPPPVLKYGNSYQERTHRRVDCIESSPERCAVLSGKGFTVVGYDFLTFTGVCYYDAIVMNPPFSNGDEHLLRAWDFMHDGEIVCLLNAETINNPYTAARKKLAAIILEHGNVEQLGPVFKTAQRKTDVDVVMVYLKKASADDTVEMWANVSQEKPVNDDIGDDPAMLAIRDDLGNMEHYYNKANEHMLIAFQHLRLARTYMSSNKLSIDSEAYNKIAAMGYGNMNAARAEWAAQHKKDAWSQVFERMQFRKWLDSKQKEEFLRDIERSSAVPFTAENIKATLANVFAQRNDLFHKSVANVFDQLTKDFHGNTITPGAKLGNGHKTNDSYKVNEKLIFPWGCTYNSWGSFSTRDSVIYRDLDRICAALDGKDFGEFDKYNLVEGGYGRTEMDMAGLLTIGQAMHSKFISRESHAAPNNRIESTYFEIRYWKVGTVHLKWKNKKLWEKFNIAAAKGKKWVGTSTQGAGGAARPNKARPGVWNSTASPSPAADAVITDDEIDAIIETVAVQMQAEALPDESDDTDGTLMLTAGSDRTEDEETVICAASPRDPGDQLSLF